MSGLGDEQNPGFASASATLGLIGLCVAPFFAAHSPFAVPWVLGVTVALLALCVLSPRLLFLACLLLIASRSTAAIGALEPVVTRPVEVVEVELVRDPEAGSFGHWAIADIDGHRVLVSSGFATPQLATAQAGDHLTVSGSIRGSEPESTWQMSNGLVGRLSVNHIHRLDEAGGIRGLANGFRDVRAAGAESLSREHQALLAGLTVGDDREQSAVVAEDFRAAGLGHLLAVSGQNVVFVLIAAGPLLGRVRTVWLRVAFTVALLIFFGFITRFEPSVSRAIVMVGLAVIARSVGRPADAARTLPVAIAALLLFDPLLAWALAFKLSVAATLGLLVISPQIQTKLSGPPLVVEVVAATVGAQLAVAPLILVVFDDISLVALPANVLAVPVSGFVMMWGMTAGFVAGLSPPWVGWLVHQPTGVLLWWIESVAEFAARVPIAPLTSRGALVGALGMMLLLVAPRRSPGSLWRRLGALTVALAVALPVIAPARLGSGQHELIAGLSLHRHPSGVDVLVVEHTVDDEEALGVLRRARLGRIELLVSLDGSRNVGRSISSIAVRHELLDIWAPPGHQVPGARTVAPMRGRIGDLRIAIDREGAVDFSK